MNRAERSVFERRGWLLGCVVAAATSASALASCATTEEGNPGPPEEPARVPVLDGADASDANASRCDGGACVAPAPCTAGAACPVDVPVEGAFALTAVWGSGPSDVWAVGSAGTILHYDGAAWKLTPSGTRYTLRAVAGSSAKDVWTVSATDVVLRSGGFLEGSATWTAEQPLDPTITTGPLEAVIVPAPGRVRAGGMSVPILPDPDSFEATYMNQLTRGPASPPDAGAGATAWKLEPGTATVHGIWAAAEDDVWIVGDNRRFVSYQLGFTAHGTRRAGEGGLAWAVVESQSGAPLRAVWGADGGALWAVGDAGQIRRITSGASRWEIVPSPTKKALRAVHGTTPTKAWAVGDDATVLEWNGATWSVVPVALPPERASASLYGVWAGTDGVVWIVGDGVVLRKGGGT